MSLLGEDSIAMVRAIRFYRKPARSDACAAKIATTGELARYSNQQPTQSLRQGKTPSRTNTRIAAPAP